MYEGLNKFLGEQFEIHIPWPSDENKPTTLKNIETAKNIPYNDNYEKPTI